MSRLKDDSRYEGTSSWSRGRRDLATPQGSNLLSAFLLCALISVLLDVVLVRFLRLPVQIVYPVIIVINAIILILAVIRIASINNRAEAERREAYRESFEKDLEMMKAWEARRKSGTSIKKVMPKGRLTYEESGVSIDTMDAALRDVKEMIRSTYRSEVLSEMGQFGGLFALDKSRFDVPVLVSSNDSVGTKLKVAFMTGKHDTVGFDIVAHCANDILVLGAEPLFFLDYLGIGKLERRVMGELMKGLTKGCKEVGCALIGGETAELPSFYQSGEYDLVGSIVGVVERQKIITGDRIRPGDRVFGLASAGLHTNGYSLARRILFDLCGYAVGDFVEELGATIGDELLKPHKSYVKPILELIRKFNTNDFRIKGLAHITGGGIVDNVPRILPVNCSAVIEKGSWDIPAVFPFMQEKGNVAESEMYRVFNMGIGMVIVVSASHADHVIHDLKSSGEIVYSIGKITEGNKSVRFI